MEKEIVVKNSKNSKVSKILKTLGGGLLFGGVLWDWHDSYKNNPEEFKKSINTTLNSCKKILEQFFQNNNKNSEE